MIQFYIKIVILSLIAIYFLFGFAYLIANKLRKYINGLN